LFSFFLLGTNRQVKTSIIILWNELLRIHNRVFPPSPKTSNSIKIAFKDPQIMINSGKTKHKDPRDFFKTVFDIPFSYCIFASNAVIDLIEKTIPVSERSFLMDATFKTCPLGQFKPTTHNCCGICESGKYF
jgi:hypothetical protein